MIQPVSQGRWQQAQTAEAKTVIYDSERSRLAYGNIFQYLGMNLDQEGKKIVEVGCGAYPAVVWCYNVEGLVIEPLWFKPLTAFVDLTWFQEPFEDWKVIKSSECWIFNAMQHVRDPELFVQKAKETAPVIRYFEPVDYGTCEYHPHTFTQDDFVRWFGEAKRYTDRIDGFFDADCCYGTWRA